MQIVSYLKVKGMIFNREKNKIQGFPRNITVSK